MSSTAAIDACKCPLCESRMRSLFATKDHRRPQEPQSWEVVWCDRCRYGKVAAELMPEEVARFYRVDYYTHRIAKASNIRASLLDRIRVHLAYRLDTGSDLSPSEFKTPGKLCDIGCGNGGNLRKFKDAGFEVIGVEPDDDARKLASEVAPVYAGTCESLPRGLDQGIDYVVLSHVLEHSISPSTALANACGILKRHGMLVVEVPNNDALGFEMFAQFWPWTDVPRHINFFTKASLLKMIEAAGFRISEIRYLGYTRQFANPWIADQQKIWKELGEKTKRLPNFKWLAWWLLARTSVSSRSRKYDSLRVHAVKI